MANLQQWGSDWPRTEIAAGLQALVALSLPRTPPAATITGTADIWAGVMKNRCTVEQTDAGRITRAFELLLAKSLKTWPEPAALVELLPSREPQKKIRYTPSEEDTEKNREAARKLREAVGG